MPETAVVQAPIVNMPNNAIPQKIMEALRWAPTYHARKMAIMFNLCKGAECYMISGKLLCDAYEKKDWKHDGSCAVNFYQWVENELGQKRSNIKRLMKVWRGIKHLLPAQEQILTKIEFSRLVEVVPYLKDITEDEQVELIHMASTNSVRDLRNNLREISGTGIADDVCGHTQVMELWKRCPDCGKFFRAEEQ